MSNSKKNTIPAFTIIGNWATRSKLLKSEYNQLTDEDLKYEVGKEEELISRFETRLKKSRDQIIEILQKGQPATI
jgi:hypothetical protein